MLTWYAAPPSSPMPRSSAASKQWAATGHGTSTVTAQPASAADWVDRNQPAMIAAVRAAAACDDHIAAVWLAGALWPLLGWHGSYREQLITVRLGVQAARDGGDAPPKPRCFAGTGHALRRLSRTGKPVGPSTVPRGSGSRPAATTSSR